MIRETNLNELAIRYHTALPERIRCWNKANFHAISRFVVLREKKWRLQQVTLSLVGRLFSGGIIFLLFLSASCDSALAARLTLVWSDRSSNEESFRIERKQIAESDIVLTSGVTYSFRFVSSNEDESKIVEAGGTTYCYRVRSFNGDGTSAYSNEECGGADKKKKVGVGIWDPESQSFSPLPYVDYDGDGRSDVTVWSPPNGYWYIFTSSNSCPSGTLAHRTSRGGCIVGWGIAENPSGGTFHHTKNVKDISKKEYISLRSPFIQFILPTASSSLRIKDFTLANYPFVADIFKVPIA